MHGRRLVLAVATFLSLLMSGCDKDNRDDAGLENKGSVYISDLLRHIIVYCKLQYGS
jgi:hypothetical protein